MFYIISTHSHTPRTRTRTHARTHARTHTHTHARTHTQLCIYTSTLKRNILLAKPSRNLSLRDRATILTLVFLPCNSYMRSPKVGEFLTVFATAVGDNVLTPDAIADVMELDSAVRAVKSIQYRMDASTKAYVYKDICCKEYGVCVSDPVLAVLKYCDPSKIRFPVHQVNISGSLIDTFLGYSLGGVTIKEGTTIAKAWRVRSLRWSNTN